MDLTQQAHGLALKGRDLVELTDYTTEEIQYLLDLAIELKRKQKTKEIFRPLEGKTLGMIFEKSSTRTRVSFDVGMRQRGGFQDRGLLLRDFGLGRSRREGLV